MLVNLQVSRDDKEPYESTYIRGDYSHFNEYQQEVLSKRIRRGHVFTEQEVETLYFIDKLMQVTRGTYT